MTQAPRLTGSVFYNYVICSRQAWLMQYQVDPEHEHDLLHQGRISNHEHYQRVEKEMALPGIKIDQIRREDGELVFGKVKKSSGGLEASVLQLAYYLHYLEKLGVPAHPGDSEGFFL